LPDFLHIGARYTWNKARKQTIHTVLYSQGTWLQKKQFRKQRDLKKIEYWAQHVQWNWKLQKFYRDGCSTPSSYVFFSRRHVFLDWRKRR
jgi:hypothetical protein